MCPSVSPLADELSIVFLRFFCWGGNSGLRADRWRKTGVFARVCTPKRTAKARPLRVVGEWRDENAATRLIKTIGGRRRTAGKMAAPVLAPERVAAPVIGFFHRPQPPNASAARRPVACVSVVLMVSGALVEHLSRWLWITRRRVWAPGLHLAARAFHNGCDALSALGCLLPLKPKPLPWADDRPRRWRWRPEPARRVGAPDLQGCWGAPKGLFGSFRPTLGVAQDFG
jgi:hypothetical protein